MPIIDTIFYLVVILLPVTIVLSFSIFCIIIDENFGLLLLSEIVRIPKTKAVDVADFCMVPGEVH